MQAADLEGPTTALGGGRAGMAFLLGIILGCWLGLSSGSVKLHGQLSTTQRLGVSQKPAAAPAPAAATPPSTAKPPCSAALLSSLLSNTSVSWVGRAAAAVDPSTPGSWQLLQPDARLRLAHCRLRRFSGPEARACLAGRPVLMLGDSLTRYQYISLMYFLEFGRWPGTAGGTGGSKAGGGSGAGGPSSSSSSRSGSWGGFVTPDPLNEHAWANWTEFQIGTTLPFRGRQLCNCGRGQYWIENRQYRSADGALALHYYWLPGPKNLSGHHGFPPFDGDAAAAGVPRCEPGYCLSRPSWSLSLADALDQVLAPLGPKVLLLNYGLWRVFHPPYDTLSMSPTALAAVARAARAAVGSDGQLLWRTTTLPNELRARANRTLDAPMVAWADTHGWQLLDAWQLTEPLATLAPSPYLDKVHFRGYVYRELNTYLLNMLC